MYTRYGFFNVINGLLGRLTSFVARCCNTGTLASVMSFRSCLKEICRCMLWKAVSHLRYQRLKIALTLSGVQWRQEIHGLNSQHHAWTKNVQ